MPPFFLHKKTGSPSRPFFLRKGMILFDYARFRGISSSLSLGISRSLSS